MPETTLLDEKIIKSLTDKRVSYSLLINTIRRMRSFRQFQQWHDEAPNKSCMYQYLSSMIQSMGLNLVDENLNIPKTGACIFIGNHPTGLLEVMVWLRTILGVRQDIKFLANYWFEVFPIAREYIISINPFEEEQDTKQNFRGVKEAARHLADGGALMIMPAGEVAHWNWQTRSVEDPPWKKSVLSLAKSKDTPIIPCHSSGQNSLMFNVSGVLHPRLRTMLLIREFANKQNKPLILKTGKSISTQFLKIFQRKPSQLAYLRLATEALNSPIFQAVKPATTPIIPAIAPNKITAELSRHTPIMESKSLAAFCIPGQQIPHTLQEIGRLREKCYRAIDEGSDSSCDIDKYDASYHQLFIWDREQEKILGALRLGLCDKLKQQVYFKEAVKVKPSMRLVLNQAIDFGRFFVCQEAPKEQNILHKLFRCLSSEMLKAQQYRYLIGQVSIPSYYPKLAIDLMVSYLSKYVRDEVNAQGLVPKQPYQLDRRYKALIDELILDMPKLAHLRKVLQNLFDGQYPLPPLLRFYVQANAQVLTFNHDHDFGCVDALMIFDRYDIPKHFSV